MRGIVYGIREVSTNTIIYIGSTRQRLLCMRKGDHTKPSVKSRPIHEYIKSKGGWNGYVFETIEEGEFESKIDLLKKEQEWINNLTPSQNCKSAFVDYNKYLQRKRDNQKIFRQNHPSYHNRYSEQRKERDNKRMQTKIECECGGTYTLQNKSKHFKTKKHLTYNNEV
jgi:hypothetical protein